MRWAEGGSDSLIRLCGVRTPSITPVLSHCGLRVEWADCGASYTPRSHRCIVACAHLGNGTDRRTATMAAQLLLSSGPARYEAVLHGSMTSPWGERRGVDTNLWQCALMWLYSAASLGHQAASTMTCYPTHSYYHDIEPPTSHCPIPIMLSARLGNNKYQF